MEPPCETPAARTYSQVLFLDIPHSYPLAAPVRCSYTLPDGLQPQSRDWVGIFKVGWSMTKDYHTFVWVETCADADGQLSANRHVVFNEYYLPKEDVEFYQFCYVDGSGQVRGASTPFCFKPAAEQEADGGPDGDDDLLVITTQEQVEQGARERAQLMQETERTKEENERLKQALQEERRRVNILEEQNEQRRTETDELAREAGRLKGELDALKDAAQNRPADTEAQEREAAAKKIVRLREERQELRGRVDLQEKEISRLTSKLRESERELRKVEDTVDLLQVDLRTCKMEKDRASMEVQKLQTLVQSAEENREPSVGVGRQGAPQSSTEDELMVECQILRSKLEDLERSLAVEREEAGNSRRRVESLDKEVRLLRDELESVGSQRQQAEGKSNAQELELKEARETIQAKNSIIGEKELEVALLTQEKNDLAREQQTLRGELEGLRKAYDDLSAAVYSEPPAGPRTANQGGQRVEEVEEETVRQTDLCDNIRTVTEPEEQPLVCDLCHERFPGITQMELEQHQQSHRVCPFCMMLGDHMEQAVFEDHVYSHEL